MKKETAHQQETKKLIKGFLLLIGAELVFNRKINNEENYSLLLDVFTHGKQIERLKLVKKIVKRAIKIRKKELYFKTIK